MNDKDERPRFAGPSDDELAELDRADDLRDDDELTALDPALDIGDVDALLILADDEDAASTHETNDGRASD